jgi:hypothetical protein
MYPGNRAVFFPKYWWPDTVLHDVINYNTTYEPAKNASAKQTTTEVAVTVLKIDRYVSRPV